MVGAPVASNRPEAELFRLDRCQSKTEPRLSGSPAFVVF